MAQIVHIIGAAGRSGIALCRALPEHDFKVQPIIRPTSRWLTTLPDIRPPLYAEMRETGVGSNLDLQRALAGSHLVVSTAHARFIPEILAAAPHNATFVFLGSTRKFTHWPDAHAQGVIKGEKAFLESGRKGVILHPTMIYGAQGEDNVQRLARLIRLMPVIPLPKGGAALVQPIYQDDVTRAIIAALQKEWHKAESLVIAGPSPIPYREFINQITLAAGLRLRPVLPVPASWLMGIARAMPYIPFLPSAIPRIETAEIRRLLEDKNFDIIPLRTKLGFSPISLQQGLSQLFAR